MITFLVYAAALAFGYVESSFADSNVRVYPVYAHASLIGIVPASKPNLLQQIPRPHPQPNPQPQPPPQPQPQPQPQPDPVDPFKPNANPVNPEPLEPYRPQQPYNPYPQQQPQPQPQPQPEPELPQPNRRGFSIKDIEHKPIFVFTTTDYKSYDIVYAGAGIGGLNSDPATKYIADFLIANDTEKLVVVFNYLNFPFTKLPDLPISRLILPNNLRLSFFAESSMDVPIVVIFTKDQLTALDNYVQTSHVSLIGQIKLPRPTPFARGRIISQ